MSSAGCFQNLVLEDVKETGKELGLGSYGVVIEAYYSGTKCAAKRIHKILLQHDHEGHIAKKFEQEILLHCDQRHPNIVQLMGVYYPPGSNSIPNLVMEFLPFSLNNCLKKQKLNFKVKYSVLLDVAKGLCYLHGKRPPIIHCDLTANNVLLASSYAAKISDLGVAGTFNKQLLAKAPGNPYIMPPEALKNGPVYDSKLDVFSYGCLILHVLANEFPMPARVLAGINISEWDRRFKYIEMIPKENIFLPLAKKCLVNEPGGRPQMVEVNQWFEKQQKETAAISSPKLFSDGLQKEALELLDVKDLNDVLTLLKEGLFNGDWEELGLILALYSPTLTNIAYKYPRDRNGCLRECVTKWLERADGVDSRGGGANYATLIEALEGMNQKSTAAHIRGKLDLEKNTHLPPCLPPDILKSKPHRDLPVQSLRRADIIPRTEPAYCVTDGNIAAIDFGTTSVSLAYTTKGDTNVNVLPHYRTHSTQIPNIVLLKKERAGIEIKAFGDDAQRVLLRSCGYSDYIYFNGIETLMRKEKTVHRDTLIESFSGEKFYLVEVIAFILKYLKDLLINHLSRTVKPLKTTDFDWVITVPAIWDIRGKEMMREAAYLAGLVKESDSIIALTPISGHCLPFAKEVNPERLSLVSRPEAAGFYCQEMCTKEQVFSEQALSFRPNKYMVIKIGGSTIGITAHTEVDGGVVVENIPIATCIACGGTRINEAFSEMLQNIVNDPGFSKFLASGDASRRMAVIKDVLYEEFETQKLLLGKGQCGEIAISLPNKFAAFYDKALEDGVKRREGIEYEDDTLYINTKVVESQLFGPTLNDIITCTLEAIKDNEYEVDTFYVVGRFGGCKYVHEKVSAAIKRAYHFKGLKACIILPISAELAVAVGAVMWRKNPTNIIARRLDATYGLGQPVPFGDEQNDQMHAILMEKGELAKSNEVAKISTKASHGIAPEMSLSIYSSGTKVARHVIHVDVPNPSSLAGFDVTVDFSGPEIKLSVTANGLRLKVSSCKF